MKIKVGTKFAKIVNESGYTKKHIAEKLEMTSQWLIQLLRKTELEKDFVIKVGTIIKHDFSKDFKELSGGDVMPYNLEKKIDRLIELQVDLLKIITKQNELLIKSLNN